MSKINTILKHVASTLDTLSQQEYYSIHVSRYIYLLQQIIDLKLPEDSLALDIGCYPPHLFEALRYLKFQVSGISSSHEKLKISNVDILNIEADCFPYKDDQFDLILFSEVLEHLTTHPNHLLSEIYRVLSPGGYLILTTPNVVRSQNLIKLLTGQNVYYSVDQLKENIYHRHNREYTKNELSKLLIANKFKITRSGYFISYPPFRQKNQNDSLPLKFIKYINYVYMKLFVHRQDTLYFLATRT